MKILYISPENTVGLLSVWKKIHERRGNTCDFITMYPSKQNFDNGICLNLPFISTSTLYRNTRNLYYKFTRGPLGDKQPIKNVPPFNKQIFLEKLYYNMRDRLWSKKIERAIINYNLFDYDYYHFEWGLDLYRNFSFAKRIKKLNKPIIAHYHGQDLRVRGIFKIMDELSDINLTSEIDLIDLYDKLNHIFLPYDVEACSANLNIGNKITICHAPTNRYYKGSDIIIPACEQIANDNDSVDFILLENMSHEEVLNHKSQSDIMIDQIGNRGGWGYGMSSIESMARGLCCGTELNENMLNIIPDHPFININANNIYNELENLINNKEQLLSYKKYAREWVLKHHDIKNVAITLYDYYSQI